MIDHVSIGVREIAKAKAFYDAALKPIGYSCPRLVVMDSGLAGKSLRPGMTPDMVRNSKTPN
jgi:catechol 2,3-dioxygenase-like lactoylglutathione lyase family enzyme